MSGRLNILADFSRARTGVSALVVFAVLLTLGGVAWGNYGALPEEMVPNVGIVPQPDAQVPLDAVFRDEDGKPVKLGDFFVGGKPVILVPVYYGCPGICNTTLSELARGIADGPKGLELGKDYEIVTFSIDPTEGPEMAKGKRENYLKSIGQPNLVGGWHFLTGEEKQIRRVADRVGFFYVKDDVQGYDHNPAIYMLTPRGRVAATIGGSVFSEPVVSLHDQLVNASDGRIGSNILQVARSCGLMRFDPRTGRYVHNPWMWAATIGGALIFITVGVFVGSLWRGEYKRHKLAQQGGAGPQRPKVAGA